MEQKDQKKENQRNDEERGAQSGDQHLNNRGRK